MKSSQRICTMLLAVATATCLASGRSIVRSETRPNVVFILADDMGAHDLGCDGSRFHETPNLDRLAREGMRFEQAYAACPVCSPTRAALLTGKYPPRTGITDFIPGNRTGKLKPPDYAHQLALDEVTLAKAFQEAGYKTGLGGKWHLGGPGFMPKQHGFDEAEPETGDHGWKKEIDRGDRVTDFAMRFLDANRSQPFFLYLPHNLVHTPLTTKRPLQAKYEKKAAALPKLVDADRFRPEGQRKDRRVQDHAIYAAMMEDLDTQVGRVLAKLDELGLRDKTIIVFTSDNGGLSTSEGSPTSNAPLRAGKGWLYEGGIRVPAIVRLPGVVKPGTICRTQTITTDWYPTLLDLCGLPLRPGQHLDGVNLAPTLRGGSVPVTRPFYWHYPHYGNQGGTPGGAIRDGAWKLIESFETGQVSLFDLSHDPGEQIDLSARQPGKTRELLNQLTNWRATVGAKMPVPNPDSPRMPGLPKKRNVLFIAVDDLKPALACAGDRFAQSPNIDRLAANGTVFTRAYCQQAVCSPSRSSLLTGRRPDTTRVFDLVTHFRRALPDVVTLPQHFKANGYYAHGIGKIYHNGYDDALSWSVPWEATKGRAYGPNGQKLLRERKAKAKANEVDQQRVRGMPFEAPDVADDYLNDGWTANRAIEILRSRKGKSEPFFLAVGFAKPHLPFVAPKKYWDLYDPDKLPVAESANPPIDAPTYAPQFGGELRAYSNIPKNGPLPRKTARSLVHGYYAAVSYMDAQVGRVLEALKEQGYADDTVVILWGDHGWHLGDHGMWCKHTNYERATRSALVMSAPGQKSAGKTTEALVEFVDIYPTLAEVCGLPKPDGLEGFSFAPLLDDPKRSWKAAAFSQFPRSGRDTGPLMGYAIRTDRYRYVEWRKRDGIEVIGRELYDHRADPNEDRNIAGDPANIVLVEQLAKQLAAGWKANAPPK